MPASASFRAFTGTDMTRKFAGQSKETCYKRFLEADKEVLDAFASLGNSESLPDESLISMLEKFVY